MFNEQELVLLQYVGWFALLALVSIIVTSLLLKIEVGSKVKLVDSRGGESLPSSAPLSVPFGCPLRLVTSRKLVAVKAIPVSGATGEIEFVTVNFYKHSIER